MAKETADRTDVSGIRLAIPFMSMALAVALLSSTASAQTADASIGAVTFDQVLAAPDDVELNLRFARQEVAAGRLQSAVSVFERLLLDNPDWDAARLAYGIVLYRLQDNLGAVREFVKLEGRLTGQQEADRLKYLRLAEAGERRLTLSGSVAAGLRVDSNPSAVASDPALRPIPGPRDTDGAVTFDSVVRAEYDLGGDPGAKAFFTVAGALRDYFETPSSNISNTGATGGVTFLGEGLEVSIFGTGGVAAQDYDLFSRFAGFGTSFAYDVVSGLRSRTRYLGGVSATYESFDSTGFSGIGSDRDGWRTSFDLGAQHFVTDAHRLSFGVGYDRKIADNDGFSFDRVALSAGYLALLGKGVYSDTNASWTWLDYDGPNGFQTFNVAREDRTWRVRTALGAPLETLAGFADMELPPALGELVLQAGVTYLRRSSNVGRYDFDNIGADLLVIKRFQF